MPATIPCLDDHLPDLVEFVRGIAQQIENGDLQDGDALVLRLGDFFTPGRMQTIENVAPGWQDMAAYAGGATLNHIAQALIALQLLPEYRHASRPQRVMLDWIVLYHDLGKQVIAGQRDSLHAFRSAAMATRSLPRLGFPTSEAYPAAIDPWTRMVLDSAVAAADGKGLIQDNRALPAIVQGIERLFGAESAASLIVQTVLLHQSLNVVPEWPNPGGLTEAELPLCISPAVLPLLEAMMLVDSDAWQLFDAIRRAKFRQGTLAVFADVRRRVGGQPPG